MFPKTSLIWGIVKFLFCMKYFDLAYAIFYFCYGISGAEIDLTLKFEMRTLWPYLVYKFIVIFSPDI